MAKSTKSFEWSVGEDQFPQAGSMGATSHGTQAAHQTIVRSDTPFFKIVSALAIVAALSMAGFSYFSTASDTSLPKAPDLPAPEPSAMPSQPQALTDAELQTLTQEALQGITELEVSMEVAPRLLEQLGYPFSTVYNSPFGRDISGKRNGGEVDPAILDLERRDILIDVAVDGDLAIATVLVENAVDEPTAAQPYSKYQERRFYQRREQAWQPAELTEALLGPGLWLESRNLRFEFRERERDLIYATSNRGEAAYARLQQLLEPSFSGREFRPPEAEPTRETNEQGGGAKLMLRTVPRESMGMVAPGNRQTIGSPLAIKIPDGYTTDAWLAHTIVERIIHIEVRRRTASKVGSDHHRWDLMAWALNGWLQKELIGRRSPWHKEAATNFDPSIYTGEPVHLSALLPPDPNAWLSREDQMQSYMLAESMIDFALAEYGEERLGDFVEGLSLYRWWADLIPAVFDVSVEEFESGWNGYLVEEIVPAQRVEPE